MSLFIQIMPHNPVKTGCKVQQMYKLPAFENKYRGLSIIKDKEIKVGGKSQPWAGSCTWVSEVCSCQGQVFQNGQVV